MEQQLHTLEYASDARLPSWRRETLHLLHQALPNIGTTVMRMLMGFIDFVMVSQLGTDAQAAISPSTILVFVTVAFGMAIANTVTTFAAQAFGRRDYRETSAFAWQTFYLAGFFTLFCWPLMHLMDPLFGLFGHAPQVREMEIAYSSIGVWCIGPSIVAAGLEGFFNAVRRPIVGSLAIAAALLFNAVGNYALIFGHFGFPQMGIAGASLATVGGWTLRAAILLAVFLTGRYAREFDTRRTWRLSSRRLSDLIKIGAPTSLQWVLDIGAWFVFMTYMMGRFGTEAMAAANVCIQYMHLSFMPAVGIGIALCALVGHAIGEGRPALAFRRATIACVMVSIYMGLIGVLFLSVPEWLIHLMSKDRAVIAAGSVMLVWAALFQVFDGFGIVYTNALRGAGDTRWPAVVFIAAAWGIFILGGYATMTFFPAMGLHGPWLACTTYIIVLGLAVWRRFRHGPWRDIRLFDPAPATAAQA